MPDDKEDGQHYAVGDESTTHDEVSCTLASVVALAETECGDPAKDHLYPGNDGERLAEDTVGGLDESADAAVDTPLQVKLKVDAHASLGCKHEKERVREGGVHILRIELAPTMHVAEKVA